MSKYKKWAETKERRRLRDYLVKNGWLEKDAGEIIPQQDIGASILYLCDRIQELEEQVRTNKSSPGWENEPRLR